MQPYLGLCTGSYKVVKLLKTLLLTVNTHTDNISDIFILLINLFFRLVQMCPLLALERKS